MINYTTPFLPPEEKYIEYLSRIWKDKWLTNNGSLVREFELKIKSYLDCENFLFLNNGTIALQMAIEALGLKGEIITTPFSFIATTSSILWQKCKPIYVDIDKSTFNLDPSKVEEKVTDRTSGILATHVYGNPCDIDRITDVAKKYNLKMIFDGAHCFGTKYNGKSVFDYGDITTVSFHATKLFHTVEGGGIFCKSKEVFSRLFFMRNFGFNGPEKFEVIGVNGKASEFHAAMGLANFEFLPFILSNRKRVSAIYDELLGSTSLERPKISEKVDFNCAYYALLFPSEKVLLNAVEKLNENDIFPRRYFYPLLSRFFNDDRYYLPVSEDISKRVLCLPVSENLTRSDQEKICSLVKCVL